VKPAKRGGWGVKAQTRSLKYCPYCGSKVKAIFDTVEAGEPYPVGFQAGKYECPDCKAITYFLPKRFRQHRVAPEFKDGDHLPITWPGFTR
jgi:hypothetical protein